MQRYQLTGSVRINVQTEVDAANKEAAFTKAEDFYVSDVHITDENDIEWDDCTEIEHA